ncbi:MAG: GntR family transcriptional regulator, partial [Burkholderiales bacterium]
MQDKHRGARAQAMALPDFVLRQFDRRGSEPDHRQLYRILQTGIRESVLTAGLKLPPTRALAQVLGIARNTVVHVYEQLALEGYVQAGVGRGTF